MHNQMELRALSGCHCLAARKRAREITRLYDSYLRPHGLRATQFSVLAALTFQDVVPLGQLAEALGLERTTLTRSTALLEKKGWIRSDESQDARIRPLRITASGRRKLQQAFESWKAAQKAAGKKQLGKG